MDLTVSKVGLSSVCPVVQTAGMSEKHLLDYLVLDKPIVFFDLETTGLEGNGCRIVEISTVKIYPDRRTEVWTQRINPEIKIPEIVSKLHGIKDEDIKDCPTFAQVAPVLESIFSDSHLGGYNIVNFDLRVLEKEFKRVRVEFNKEGRAIIDPMKIYHRFVPFKKGEGRRLINAYKYYCGKELVDSHAAEADILATIEVLTNQLGKHNGLPKDVYKLGELCIEKLPEYVDFNGKLIWRRNERGEWEIALNYLWAEHRGKTLKEVVETDMDFIRRVLEPKEFDFSEEVKEIVRNAVKGIYPSPPQNI